MKCGKELGEDGIVTDLLKDTGEKFHKELAHLFTSAYREKMDLKSSV